jgi:hypothetical protein
MTVVPGDPTPQPSAPESPMVPVAPREIVDIVYRASRLAGCSSSSAQQLAADVAHCETRCGEGLATWLVLRNLNTDLNAMVERSALVWDALARAQTSGAADVHLGGPIAHLAVCRALAVAARRGWHDQDLPRRCSDPVLRIRLSSEQPDSLADPDVVRLGELMHDRASTAPGEGCNVGLDVWYLINTAAGVISTTAGTSGSD